MRTLVLVLCLVFGAAAFATDSISFDQPVANGYGILWLGVDFVQVPGSPPVTIAARGFEPYSEAPGAVRFRITENVSSVHISIAGKNIEVSRIIVRPLQASPCDVNLDRRVTLLDLIAVRNALGSPVSANPHMDVNWDGVIDIADLLAIRAEL